MIAAPRDLAHDVEALGIFRIEHRLGVAVTALLSVVSLHRVAAEVPDEGGGREAQLVAGVEHAPANVDVVACGPELRIEAADFRERRFREDHVAAREMLGAILGDQHVAGRARRRGAARFDPSVFMRRVVRAAASVEIVFDDRAHHQRQPVRVDDAVGVGVGDEFAARRMHPDVARDAQALVGLADEAKLGEVHRDVGGAVARAVVDDDHFEIRVVEAAERFQARAHRALGVVSTNHDRDHRLVRRSRRASAVERHERHHVRRAHQAHAQPVMRHRGRHRRSNHASRTRTKRHCYRFVLPRRCVAEFDHDRPRFRDVVQGNDEIANLDRRECGNFRVEKIFFED